LVAGDAVVLCISGRGAFDEVATAIAVQLLTRQQITTVATTYEHYRSTRGGGREAERAGIICIVSLDTAEAPPYLRNLLRRIRSQPAPATVIVGFGGQSEGTSDPGVITGVINNARNATTFRGLVEECRAAVVAIGHDEHVQGTA
jgi:hypothetical protein